MKIWTSKKKGLSRTNKMRQKGSRNKERILKKEFKNMLDLIYNFNLHNPDATSAKIDFVNKGLVPLLEEVGYKLEFEYELGGRFYYTISWEQYRMNIKRIQYLTKKNDVKKKKKRIKEQYKEIKEQIKRQVKVGHYYTYYSGFLHEENIEKLQKQGFIVKGEQEKYCTGWHISWEI